MKPNWRDVDVGGKFTISLPANLVEIEEHGIDSFVSSWAGEGITVRVDQGLFSDPLTSYSGRPNFTLTTEEIDDHLARVVSFDKDDSRRFYGVHFGDLDVKGSNDLEQLTVVVETNPEDGDKVSTRIFRSIKFQGVLP